MTGRHFIVHATWPGYFEVAERLPMGPRAMRNAMHSLYTRYGLCLPRADRDRHGPQDKLRQKTLNNVKGCAST